MAVPLIFAAVLFYLSFPNYFSLYGLWPLAAVFAVPLFFTFEKRSLTRRIILGFLFGLLANGLAVNWMIPYSFKGYVFLVLVLAVQPVLFAVLYPRRAFRNPLLKMIYVPAAWVVSEYVRALAMRGESWNLAHTQTFHLPLLQLANLLGSYSISFVLMVVNICIYQAILESRNFKNDISVAVALVAVVYGYGYLSLQPSLMNEGAFRLGALQPNINYRGQFGRERLMNIAEDHLNLTAAALKRSKPDLIVWPETAVPTDILADAEMKNRIQDVVRTSRVPLLTGAALQKDGQDHNSAVVFDRQGEVAGVYHKQYLVPLSEYIPAGVFWKTSARIFKIESFGFAPGRDSGVMPVPETTKKFAVLICSEDNISSLMRRNAGDGADFAVVLLNNGWLFQKSGLVMHGQHSIMRAVENGLPVVRVANTGWSCLIDPKGRVVDGSFDSLGRRMFFEYRIPPGTRRTLYNIIGDTFCWLCAAFVIMSPLVMRDDR